MDFSELVKIRQSDRKYADKPVERQKIEKCIETTRLSPSANNSQPWKFIIVDNKELKEQLAKTSNELGMNKFVNQAPVIIAVVLEDMKVISALASRFQDKNYSLIDVGIAVNQLCLQATEIGLGTCIIGWFNEKKAKNLLQVPANKRIPLLITLGYSASQTRNKIRKTTQQISSWNKY